MTGGGTSNTSPSNTSTSNTSTSNTSTSNTSTSNTSTSNTSTSNTSTNSPSAGTAGGSGAVNVLLVDRLGALVRMVRLAKAPPGGWTRALLEAAVAARLDSLPPLSCEGYVPTVAIQEHVRARNPRCTGYDCPRKAARCDLDHDIPWPRGPTHVNNLDPRCRRQHEHKTRGLVHTRLHPDGAVETTMLLTGLVITTRPEPLPGYAPGEGYGHAGGAKPDDGRSGGVGGWPGMFASTRQAAWTSTSDSTLWPRSEASSTSTVWAIDIAAAAARERRRHLHEAAGVGGHQEVGAGGEDRVGLAVAERPGGVGVEQVVDTGRAAAQLGVCDLAQLDAGDGREQLTGLGADALRVGEVAGVVVGHRHRQRVPLAPPVRARPGPR